MESLRSHDAEIFYEIRGSGPPVVLLHPFPCDHEFWNPVATALEARYRLILPDLRGHGASEIGEGPALMSKHAFDIACLLDAAGVRRAVFIGCSIGGYILFEFWRRFRARVTALALLDAKAQAEIAGLEVTGESGGGMVKVVMNGRHEVKRVQIEPTVVGEDREMLEDLVAAAINDAVHRLESATQAKLSAAMGGLSLPPGVKLPL